MSTIAQTSEKRQLPKADILYFKNIDREFFRVNRTYGHVTQIKYDANHKIARYEWSYKNPAELKEFIKDYNNKSLSHREFREIENKWFRQTTHKWNFGGKHYQTINSDDLDFSKEQQVYAFGRVWNVVLWSGNLMDRVKLIRTDLRGNEIHKFTHKSNVKAFRPA